jgi:hypothetical protein
MQRIGEETARVFKALAGQDRNEPMSSHIAALYTVLFFAALIVLSAWLTGGPS